MLRTSHTSSVTEDQIDHLGHMNVRFYGVNAHQGTKAILADLGWTGRHFVDDTYTRHHREQLLGTPLEVRSAVLSADADRIRLHHELRASDSDVLAATFVHGIVPLEADGSTGRFADEVVDAARAEAIELPDHAATRTISLDADLLATAPSIALLEERSLAMRKPRHVTAEECDAEGRYRSDMTPMLTWGGEPVEGELEEMLHETGDGHLIGWAVMETRVQLARLPRVGDRVQSFAAVVAVHDKVTHRVSWVYDLDRGDLLTTFESVNMAFDIRARRPVSLPAGYRQRTLDGLQPDLVPQALAT
jgi:acyl-CoA thioesterase FadM